MSRISGACIWRTRRSERTSAPCPFRAASHVGVASAFIGTAECDPTRDDAEAYAAKLRAAGVTVEARRYPGMVHGFVSWIGFLPGAREAMADACAFLTKHCVHVAA